ncbi:DUF6214 family protein [Streptomyces lushanensis]|uniref:DUF6214 family protein n=1 Tax=Streptomyces lushanensis TaxID=1434255 RepID=UPI00316AE29A
MSEHKWISAQEPHERDAYDWPVWEVQGHGTVTGAGDPRDGATRREILPPWVDIRLTFADGARLDVLAVVRDGRIAIEDAQADPPLALEGFAALAGAIEAPLQNACQVVSGRHRPPVPGTVVAEPPAVATVAGGTVVQDTVVGESPADADQVLGGPVEGEPAGGGGAAHETSVHETSAYGPAHSPSVSGAVRDPAARDVPAHDVPVHDIPVPEAPRAEPREEAAAEPVTEPEREPAAESEPEPVRESSGRHRARPSPPRGSAARRSVAEIYRAAQQAGQDPVLAVMSATGFSRRKSLKLIAGARDEGHLTPRHHRR